MIDADEILGTSEFTTTVTLPSGSTTEGIFDNLSEDVGSGYGMMVQAPRVVLASAVAEALNERDRLVIGGVTYKVKSPFTPDGAGLTGVPLET